MAVYTLFGQIAPTALTGQGNNGNSTSVGVIFSLSQAANLTGLWFWSDPGQATLPAQCALFDTSTQAFVSGTENTSPTWSGAAGSGWIKCSYDGSIALEANHDYIATVCGPAAASPDDWLSFNSGYSWPLTSGIITAPVSDGSMANGPYNTSGFGYPNSGSNSGYNWWVDVEVTVEASSSLSITTTSLSSAVQHVSYSATLGASGGTAPYTWSVTSGSLPSGLSLTASTGVIAGTSTTTGTSTFTVEVTDAASNTATQTLSITTVNSAPQTLWDQATPTLSGTGSNGSSTVVGTIFSLTQAAPLTGIWYFSPAGAAALPAGCALFDTSTQAFVSGTENTSPTWSGAAGSGWVKCSYGGSVVLDANHYYVVAIEGPSSPPGMWLGYTTGYAYPVTNGIITAPIQLSGVYNGPYVDGPGSFVYPTGNGGGLNWWVDVEITPGPVPLSITTTSLSGAMRGGSYSAVVEASGGTAPYTWAVSSGSLPTGLHIDTSSGTISGIPTTSGTSTFTVTVTDADSNTATQTLSIIVTSLTATRGGTDGWGVETWTVTAAINTTGGAGPQPMRVLRPSNPVAGKPHAFLYVLPVEPGQGTTFGDGIGVHRLLNAHNNYNLTIIQPGFPVDPWYADNPNDPTTQQETFMLALVQWAVANLAITGTEKHYLIGFSKSGVGGQSLQLRYPDVFQATASWDFPADQSFSTFGSDSATVYGTEASFDANYALTQANVAGWSTPFTTANRIWMSGYYYYGSDVSDYDALLTSLGMQHTYTPTVYRYHRWDSGWVEQALTSLFGQPPVFGVPKSLV